MNVTVHKHLGYSPANNRYLYLLVAENGITAQEETTTYVREGSVFELPDEEWSEYTEVYLMGCTCSHIYYGRTVPGKTITCPICGEVETITSNSLLIPVLLNFTYFPARYSLGVSGGIFFGAPMEAAMLDSFLNKSYTGTLSAAAGLAAGINAGIKIGPGVLFADIRYMADLVNTTFTSDEISVTAYRRGILGISLGYSIGIFQKNN